MQEKKLLLLVEELESNILLKDKINPAVSRVNAGWHIEHILMATIIIIDQLSKSDPAMYKRNFNLNRLIAFTINRIPRGSGKAPKVVQPNGNPSEEKLLKYIEIVKEKIDGLKNLQPNHHFKHPYLGRLNYKGGLKFMLIHLKHHLKIIRDINKAK